MHIIYTAAFLLETLYNLCLRTYVKNDSQQTELTVGQRRAVLIVDSFGQLRLQECSSNVLVRFKARCMQQGLHVTCCCIKVLKHQLSSENFRSLGLGNFSIRHERPQMEEMTDQKID